MLSEWHLSPDYIVNNWTDELLNLMVEKLSERKQREVSTVGSSAREKPVESEEMFFARAKNLIKVEKK